MDELDKESVDRWLVKNESQRKALRSMLKSLNNKELSEDNQEEGSENNTENKNGIMNKITQLFKKLGVLTIMVWIAGSLNLMAQDGGFVPGKVRVKIQSGSVEMVASGLKQSAAKGQQFKTGLSSLDKIHAKFSATEMKRVFPYAGVHESKHIKHGLHLWYEIDVANEADLQNVIREYAGNEYVEMAEAIGAKSVDYKGVQEVASPSEAVMAVAGTNDPYLIDQWHLYNDGSLDGSVAGSDINALEAWDITTGTSNVVVAVVDGGIDVDHEDLKANMWVNEAELNGEPGVDDDNNGYVDDVHGYNFADNQGEITAQDHGTHVAGTVAATSNNGKGVAGVAGGSGNGDGVRIIGAQVFSDENSGNFAPAIVYGADNGAVISQNSWSYQSPGVYEQAVLDAIDYFIEEAGNYPGSPMKGGLVFFAAGNNGVDQMKYPAYYENAIAIASTGPDYAKASYSNYGSWIDLTTTGGEARKGTKSQVLSTLPGNRYGYLQGTSMATPHASGIAALVVSKFGSAQFTNTELRKRLFTAVSDIDTYNPEYAGKLGFGFMDAALALAANDEQAPAATTDLTLLGISQDFATINFSVPADAGDGTPQLYKVYWSVDPLMEGKKEMVIQNDFRSAGDLIEVNVEDLDFETTYYFAVVSEDRWGNMSELSNVVEGTTNRGPDIATDKMSLSANIDVSAAMTALDSIKVQNNDTGILNWEAETREVSNFASYTRAQLPAQGTIKSVAQMDVQQQTVEAVEQFDTREAAPNAWEASEKAYFSRYPSYVIGETDTTMTNSSATKFFVDEADGFNLTYVQALLQLDQEDGPAVMEIYKGEEIHEDNLIYSDDRFAGREENDLRFYAINTAEQLFFEQGETFWVVFHAPAGNLYPLGIGAETSPEYSDYSLMSFDLGETWVPLAGALENESFAWAVTVASKTEPLHKYTTLTPDEGKVVGIGEENMNVNIDASQLINGTYRSNVVISSNDEDTPLHRVAATVNVTGHKPELTTNNILDFGSVFNGLSSTKEMTIINNGYGRFRTQSVTSSNPAFTVNSSTWSLNVAARSEATMSLTYTPTGVGNENAVITMTSQNGDVHKFNVFGVGTAPAEIAVTPSVINMDSVMVGESVQANLTLTNTGQYPLQYGFPAFADDLSHIENLPANVQRFPYAMQTTPYDSTYVFNDISATGTDITGFFTQNSQAEYKNVELGFDFPFFGEKVNNLFITKRGALTLGTDGNFNATSQFHGSAMPDGYIAAMLKEWALSLGGSIHYKRELGKLIVQYTNVRHANDRDNVAITFQIELYSSGDIKFIYDKFDGLFSYQLRSLYSAVENREKNDGVVINSSYDKVELPMAPQQIVHIHSPGIGLIKDVAEAAGMIQPGESKDLVLTVDGDKLIEGTHKEYIAVLSNDPFNSSEAIEVNIDVIGGGSSEVVLSETEVNFGDVFQQATVSGTIGVKNEGSRQIDITNVTFTNGQLSFDEATSVVIEPNQTFYVNYTLDTQNLGPVADTLVLTDTDGNTYEVVFTGQIVDAPGIEVVETSYAETLEADQVITRAFQVTNTGKATLEYAVAASEHVTINEPVAATNAVEDFTYVYRSTYDDNSKPTFQWIKLTEEDKVNFRVAEEIYWEQLELPFEFDFYQQKYSKVWMSTQGALSFEEEVDVTYAPFVPPTVPNNDGFDNFIAPYFAAGGPNTTLPEDQWGRYMKVFEDKVVFEWRGYNNLFGIGGVFNIQAILYKSGKIKFQYKHDPNQPIRAFYGLIGMENQTGTDGIQIAHYQEYLANEVAVDIYPAKKETLEPGQSRNYDLNFSAVGSNADVYTESLKVINNTPLTPDVEVPVELTVTGEPVMTFIPDTLDLGEQMVVPDAAYEYSVKFTNTGKKTMTANNLRMEDPTTAVIEHLVYNFRWGWSWQPVRATDAFVVEPGFESKEFRITFSPQVADANYTNKLLADTDFGTTEEMPIIADFKLPPVFTVNDEAVYHMAYDNTIYTHTLNMGNLEGESPLKYSMGITYNRDDVTPAAVPATTGEKPMLLSKEVSPNLLEIEQTNTEFATVLKYDDATSAYTAVGYNGVTEFTGSTKFIAPSTGFNLSHVQTWYAAGTMVDSSIQVEIRVGEEVEDGDVIYQESFNYSTDSPDSEGELITFALSEVVELGPYEKFYVVFTYPLGANYPQGMVRLDETYTNTFEYYAQGFWYDLADAYPSDGFMVRAAEMNKAEKNWLTVTGDMEGEVAVGGTLDVNVELHPARTAEVHNVANLSIESNDPFNNMVSIPVTLEINQAPVLEKEAMYYVTETDTLDLALTVTDIHGDALSSATLLNPAENASLAMENNMVLFTYTPGYEESGIHDFEVLLTDEFGVEGVETIKVDVIDLNRAPVVSEIDKKFVDLYIETIVMDLAETFTDADNDAMSFQISASDENVVDLDLNGSVLTVTPLKLGVTMVSLKGLDNRGGEAAVTFEVEVINTNTAPEVSPIADQTLNLYTDLFEVFWDDVFSDPDGDAVTFEAYTDNIETVELFYKDGSVLVKPRRLGKTQVTLKGMDPREGEVTTSFTVRVVGNITNDQALSESWKVHPNPVDEVMNIKMYSPVIEKMTINIYNAMGILIKTAVSEGSDDTIQVPVDNLQPGIYFVEIATDNAKSVKKIVKQ